MDEEAVVHPGQWVDHVDVRGEEQCRLRLPDCHNHFGLQRREHVAGPFAHQTTDLREHVVGVGITGVVQSPIALRVQRLEGHVGAKAGAPLDTHPLSGHRDVGMPGADHLAVRHEPHGGCIDAAADVEPFHDHRPAELLGDRLASGRRPGSCTACWSTVSCSSPPCPLRSTPPPDNRGRRRRRPPVGGSASPPGVRPTRHRLRVGCPRPLPLFLLGVGQLFDLSACDRLSSATDSFFAASSSWSLAASTVDF